MAYDEDLAERVRRQLARVADLAPADLIEKRMFGGVAFLVRGNLCVGIWKESLVARLGVQQADEALELAYVDEFPITGRPMKGWVLIAPEGVEEDQRLGEWIDRARRFVATLPPK